MNANLYERFRVRFASDLGRPFIETASGARLCYADLERESGRIAACLRSLGLEKGDRVAVQVEKSPRALFLYLACLRAGLVYLPLNPAYPEPELDYFFSDAEPALLVCRPESLAKLEPLASRRRVGAVLCLDRDGEGSLAEAAEAFAPMEVSVACTAGDPAALLYTSGTTGRPKGAVLSHRNLASNAEVLQRAWGFRANDVLLHALPLFHTHGLFVACHCVLQCGASMLLLPKFDVEEVLRHLPRASVFMGVPTFYVRLLQHPGLDAAACRDARLFVSGSAPLLPQTFEAFRERTGHRILERYGMTESGMVTSNPLEGQRKVGTVGFALSGVTLRVVDSDSKELPSGETGAVECKGPNVFGGYWRMPHRRSQDFTADGYFRSGDLGVLDADGYLTLVEGEGPHHQRWPERVPEGGGNPARPRRGSAGVRGHRNPRRGSGGAGHCSGSPGAARRRARSVRHHRGPQEGAGRLQGPQGALTSWTNFPRNAMGKVAEKPAAGAGAAAHQQPVFVPAPTARNDWPARVTRVG